MVQTQTYPKVFLERTRIEVGSCCRGRPSFRWTTGYYVVAGGEREYPPCLRNEAYARAREIGAAGPIEVR